MAFRDFFFPKWQHSDPNVALRAVEKITDTGLLIKIVKKSASWAVRRAVVEKLTDEKVLEEVATKDVHALVRQIAVQKLTDDNILLEIAMSEYNNDVFIEACTKLINKEKAIELATERSQNLKKELDNYEKEFSRTLESYTSGRYETRWELDENTADGTGHQTQVYVEYFEENPRYDYLKNTISEVYKDIGKIERHLKIWRDAAIS